jgi:DNA-binding transcriptional ArsR family regulator
VDAARGLARFGALLADPARARIVAALLDGEALTATELAYQAGVSPATTSSHLARLTDGEILAVAVDGRQRHYRIANAGVAGVVEAVLGLGLDGAPAAVSAPHALEPIRIARTCYDHLAGRLGVAVTRTLIRRHYLAPAGRDFQLTSSGETFLTRLGVDVAGARRQRRVFARQCLDWTERQPHLAGALGAALASRWLELRWAMRGRAGRHLVVTDRGRRALRRYFAVKPAAVFD